MSVQNRIPASPGTGAARGFARTIIASVVGALIVLVVPAATVELRAAIVGLVMLVAVLPALEAWGKFLRERGYNAPFVFVLGALLLSGCAMETGYVNWVLGDATAQRLTGPQIVTVESEGVITSTCTEGCELREAAGRGFSEGFAANFLGRLVDAAAGFFGQGPPPQMPEIRLVLDADLVRGGE